MRKYLIILIICILLLATINDTLLKIKPSNDQETIHNNTNNLPISNPTKAEEIPLLNNNDNKNKHSTKNQQDVKNEPSNDIFSNIKTETKVNPIILDINEIDEYIIENQKEIDNDFGNDISVSTITEIEKTHILHNFNKITGHFTENQGQVGNNSVRYYIQGGGVWFLDDGVVFEIREEITIDSRESSVQYLESEFPFDPLARLEPPVPPKYKSVILKLNFEGTNRIIPQGRGILPHQSNFFYGNDSSKWYNDVPNYKEIIYKNLYNNINLRYYTTSKGLKYDFIVHPGGNPNDIKLNFEGADDLFIDIQGNINIRTNFGSMIDSELYISQETENGEKLIIGEFKILNTTTYGFKVLGDYNRNKNLVIDPLIYSTYVGGNNVDVCWGGFAIDPIGHAFVTGYTASIDFPTTTGVYNRTYRGIFDVFVFKLNSNGSKLIYSTYVGGSTVDVSYDIDVDINGNAYVTGFTNSSNFPTTIGAFDRTYYKLLNNKRGSYDGFVFKLNNNGSILNYSTYIGGNSSGVEKSDDDFGFGIVVDSFENAYVTGRTDSSNFPITPGAYDTTFNGTTNTFVVKINLNGSKLLYSTFIGGSIGEESHDIVIDNNGNAFITGYTTSSDFPTTPGAFDTILNGAVDSFISKLDKTGSKLLYSTFIGGNSNEHAFGIDLDLEGNIYITGRTGSIDFPNSSSAYDRSYNGKGDIFILKLNLSNSSLMYSTYIGGNSFDYSNDVKADSMGNAYVTGYTSSTDFPITTGAYATTLNGSVDVVIFKLNQNGTALQYSSYIGGSNNEWGFGLELNSTNEVFITGHTTSSDFPTTQGAFDIFLNGNTSDCFVLKLNLSVKNTPPTIRYFTATRAPEGSKVIFTVNASDPEHDSLTYSFDFQNDSIFDYVGKNNTASYTWGDDYSGTAVVKVSDGNLSAEANTTVIIYNLKPIVNSISLTNVTKISQNATLEWISKYNSSVYSGGAAIAITADSYGSVYITGHMGNATTHDDYVTIKFDTYGHKLWENRYNGPGNGLDWPSSIDADLNGNVYVTGKSTGIGTGWDYATIAYDSLGKELWVARYNGLGNGQDIAEAIAITPVGNIIVTGVSNNGTNNDCTTIAYDWNGNELWIERYNDPIFSNSSGYKVDIDSNGNVYIGGSGITKGFDYDYIIIKYDSKGNELWSRSYNGIGNGYDFLFDMKVNKKGNVFVTGRSQGINTSADYATVKYYTNGTSQWINRYNGPGNTNDLARGLDIDSKENVYVTGYSGSGSDNDFATIAYNSIGKLQWIARHDGSGKGHDNAYAISVDSLSNVYVTGKSFGNGTNDDITTVAYNGKGERLWVKEYNGPDNRHDGCFAMTIDSMENIYVSGYITNSGKSEYITIKYSIFKSYNCNEGVLLTFNASGFDQGSDDLNFIWSWDDGTNRLTHIYYNDNKSPDPSPSPNGTYPFKRTDLMTHTYSDDGVYLIKLNLSDDDGGLTTYKLKIIVNNIAPKIKEIEPCIIKEGESFNITAVATDPGSDDLIFNWTFEKGKNLTNVYYNNGLGPDPYPSPNGIFPFFANDTINYTYLDNGTYKILLTVSDDDNSSVFYSVNITVLDLSPTANSGPDHRVYTKENITFNASDSYSYPDDIAKYIWDFGDGTNSSRLEVNHSYSKIGVYTVTLTVIDEDGSIDNDTVIVYVNETKHWCGYIAYEDLKKQNWCDYDYNDWGMMMYVRRDYNYDGNLTSIDLEFIGMLKEAGYNHEILLGIGISESINYNWNAWHFNQTNYMFWNESGLGSGDLNITIFNYTGKNVGYSSVVTIEFKNPVNPALLTTIPFDTYMYVFNTKEEIHVGYNQTISINDAKGSNPFIGLNESPLILIIELDEWTPPKECQRIWKAYPYFDDWIYSKRTKYLDWYKNPA